MPASRRPRSPSQRGPADSVRIAAIDIGSNSIRQLIADVSPDGAIDVVDELKAAPRLGAGVGKSARLSDDAMSRAIEALARMALLARRLECDRVVAVATSAVREAANGPEFVREVARATGLQVRVIDGEEEARLSFRSALAHFDLGTRRSVAMDIGGGSLELALSVDGLLERLVSLPFGAVRMMERFLTPYTGRKQLRELRRHVRDALRAALPKGEWTRSQVIGSGGTFTNLAGMHLARRGLLTAQTVHATPVHRTELEHILDMLAPMSPAERLEVPGLNAERADIIVGGLAVAAEVLARLDATELIVSRYGIREGLLLEAARVKPKVADPGEARARSIAELAERCHYDRLHAEHVRTLALQLFDAIGERLGCVPADRQILADAALLHDIGYHIGYERHHKHSYHLIVHAELLGVTPLEQVIIGNVARYHRGARPRRTQRNFGVLEKPTRRRIRRLAALLRVADGLDRGHIGAVERVVVRWTSNGIRLGLEPAKGAPSLRLEVWGASRRAGLLEREAGARIDVFERGRLQPAAPAGA